MRVESDKKNIEIPTLLSCDWGNSAENGAGKFKLYVILNFSSLDFLVCKIKEQEFQKNIYRSLPDFCTYPGVNYLYVAT